jgi:hypothetical protein
MKRGAVVWQLLYAKEKRGVEPWYDATHAAYGEQQEAHNGLSSVMSEQML